MATINSLDSISDLGVGFALIYRQDDGDRTSDIAFWISLATALLLGGIGFAAAPAIATYFGDERLHAIVQALSLSFVLSGLSNIHVARMRKSLDFRSRLWPETLRAVVKGAASIGFALSGFGVWSLVLGHLLGLAAVTAAYWRVTGWRPRPAFDAAVARQMIGYGIHIVLVGLCGVIFKNIDNLMVGHLLDTTQLGYYVMAFAIPELMVSSICYVVSQSAFSAYSRIQNDAEALKAGYTATIRYMALVITPIALGLVVVAPDFITIAYTDKWAPSVPVLQALAVAALISALGFNTGDVYKATGRPGLLNAVATINLLVALPFFWFGAQRGILALGIAQIALSAVTTGITFAVALRILRLPASAVLRALEPAVVAGGAMVAVCGVVSASLGSAPPELRLPAVVAVGVVTYVGTLWVVYNSVVATIAAMFSHAGSR